MNLRFFARSLCVLILPCLVACGGGKITSLRVDSDPEGADVEETTLGYLGTTPLPLKLSKKDLKKLNAGSRVTMNLTIGKKGYVSVRAPATWEEGTHHIIKKTLQERLDQTEITSDPVGVGVFLLVLDEGGATAAQKNAFKADPLTFYKGAPGTPALTGHPELVTQRFLGSTPTSYIFDPDNALENNDPLLFQKEGYHDQIVLFKVTQRRIHRIMTKVP